MVFLAVDGNDVVTTASAMPGRGRGPAWWRRPHDRRGGHLPVGTVTTRATRSGIGRPGEGGLGGTRPARRARRCAPRQRDRRGHRRAGVDGGRRAGQRPSTRPERSPARPRSAVRLRAPAGPSVAQPSSPDVDAPVFRTMDAIHDRARSRARRGRRCVPGGDRRGVRRQRLRAHAEASVTGSGTTSATRPRSRRPPGHRPRRSARQSQACGRWWSSCTWTSWASASISC